MVEPTCFTCKRPGALARFQLRRHDPDRNRTSDRRDVACRHSPIRVGAPATKRRSCRLTDSVRLGLSSTKCAWKAPIELGSMSAPTVHPGPGGPKRRVADPPGPCRGWVVHVQKILAVVSSSSAARYPTPRTAWPMLAGLEALKLRPTWNGRSPSMHAAMSANGSAPAM